MSDRIEKPYSHDILSSEDVKIEGDIERKYRFEYLDLLHEYDKWESKWHSSIRLPEQQRESIRKQMAILCKQLARLELSTPIQNILSRADVIKLDIELTFVENFKVFQYEFSDLGDLDIETCLTSLDNNNSSKKEETIEVKAQANKSTKKSKKPVLKSVLCVIPSIIVFMAVRLILSSLLAIITALLISLPIIGKLIEILFYLRGDSPIIIIAIVSTAVSYYATKCIQEKMMNHSSAITLTRKIHGTIIVISHVIFLFINLIASTNILVNIVCIIAGLVFIFSSKKEENNVTDI